VANGELTAGATGIATRLVQDADLAVRQAAEAADVFAPVVGTARLAALVEAACARALKPVLGAGECSVSAGLEWRQAAQVAAGGTVRVKARYAGRDGEAFLFDFSAEDDGGLFLEGKHRRLVVAEKACVAEARARQG